MIVIRPMVAADIEAILAIQADAYFGEEQEEETVISVRLDTAPDTAWVAQAGQGLQAYLVTYPSRLGALTALGENFQCAADPDCLYLHDLAVLSAAKGTGMGLALINKAIRYAEDQGYPFSALISVQNSVGFWQRQGYSVVEKLSPQQQARLATYTGPAYYMSKRLNGAG
ncbi:GNAT family N-acetyltransferase [Paenalcaligenes niemegkensis]|uniref:GNAT family N-acetyltransferase n=1 Tax=Paenalcaligenes niemegkensis TaxID=2895469 RepID=UPI001EE9AC8C|nr:GNAT family N-acetyltransferase [Paenalcaligenes niemegkensis]MCQ9616074.1 GNAT family N-acetyltransferase [Paenalcaligenes niemegkensis]